ncbi:hypothetical protein SESBI_18935 [Sesbania bispinosa]|nr:hypothetical protein SESBI_28585 [Sesbania bispinosa]KAJ1414395.1 hypothetical protein SESBI_18935 [Sesbania bispinosa]
MVKGFDCLLHSGLLFLHFFVQEVLSVRVLKLDIETMMMNGELLESGSDE